MSSPGVRGTHFHAGGVERLADNVCVMVLPVFTDLPLFMDQQLAHAVAVVLLIRLIVGQRLYGLHPARDRRYGSPVHTVKAQGPVPAQRQAGEGMLTCQNA